MADDKGPKYKVGISSGWWSIGKDPALLGIAMKIGGFGATSGVQFNQIDLDTTAEFFEPRLLQNVKKIKSELKLEVGIHAEIGKIAALESAERRIWEQAHIRLVELAKGAAGIGAAYINFHLSSEIQVQYEEARLRPFGHMYQVVGPDGKSIAEFCKDSGARDVALEEYVRIDLSVDEPKREGYWKEQTEEAEALAQKDLENFRNSPTYLREVDIIKDGLGRRGAGKNEINQAIRNYEEEAHRGFRRARLSDAQEKYRNPSHDKLMSLWLASPFGKYFVWAGEIGAYLIVAHDLYKKNDAFWTNIVGSTDPNEAYHHKPMEFNAAIAASYIEGHLRVKDHPLNKKHLNGMSVLEWCEKHKIVLAFESPEVEMAHELGGAAEGIYRLFHPMHAYYFVKKIGSPSVKLCIDFEHTLAQKIDVDKVLDEVPGDFGKYVMLFHLGEPKPYQGKAHIPIPMGSQAQEIIYTWLYKLKKKGFENGILIFERGGGRSGAGKTPFEVFEHSVWVLRKFAEFLEKGIKPDDLPPEFFGIAEEQKDIYARQSVIIREHAWDPLEGLLMIPEEKHGFLGKAAVDKGKAKEWERGRFR